MKSHNTVSRCGQYILHAQQGAVDVIYEMTDLYRGGLWIWEAPRLPRPFHGENHVQSVISVNTVSKKLIVHMCVSGSETTMRDVVFFLGKENERNTRSPLVGR